MKQIEKLVTSIIVASMLISCVDEKKTQAEEAVHNYEKYIDSVSRVSNENLSQNWNEIENGYIARKTEAESALEDYKDRKQLDDKIQTSTVKYEDFKSNYILEAEKTRLANLKIAKRNALFDGREIGDDVSFSWVNKDNILKTFDHFVNTVYENKDSYSREDWDEIKMLYEALGTRKNTVEKEGLSSSDNLKIAGLKIKFAPMYTLNRMGAKAEENAEAKQ
ncbi:MAG: hypothetical protein ACK4RM_05445 [Flavobacterium sp.]